MKTVAIGSRAFVSGFQLAGVSGLPVQGGAEAMTLINSLVQQGDIGLILVSNDVSREVRSQLLALKAKRPVPLIFEVPAPGSKPERVEYRDMLRQILGV